MLNAEGKVEEFIKNTRFTLFLSPAEQSFKIFRTVVWGIENSRTEEGKFNNFTTGVSQF